MSNRTFYIFANTVSGQVIGAYEGESEAAAAKAAADDMGAGALDDEIICGVEFSLAPDGGVTFYGDPDGDSASRANWAGDARWDEDFWSDEPTMDWGDEVYEAIEAALETA